VTGSIPVAHDGANIARLRSMAALAAVELVEPGMVVGLGGGATAAIAVRGIGRRLATAALHGVVGVPCSLAVEQEARQAGIPLVSFQDRPTVDLTIDGADEVDPSLNLIKGGGGALLREKVVAQASRREVIIVDAGKLSRQLGTRHPLPLEVLPFGWMSQVAFVKRLRGRAALWRDATGAPRLTDQSNFVLMCDFGPIARPEELAQSLAQRAGIIEHGLFVGVASEVLVGTANGVLRLLPGLADQNLRMERSLWN